MRIALVDGYNLVFRAFYAMPELSRKDGFPTGAIHGWVRSLWWVDDHLEPDRILVFFDLGGPTRQTTLQADYKANRAETPEPLLQQIPVIKEWTRAMGYAGIEKEGVEADDLIAAYAVECAAAGHEVLVVSADKDLAQLVGPGVTQLLPPPTANPRLGWRRLDPAAVEAKFGVPPRLIPDYLALIGDTSDNSPGLKGVGPKTAAKWLQQYGSIEGILAHSGELTPKRFQGLVHAEQATLRRNLEMTRLDPVHTTEHIADERAPQPAEVYRLLEAMEMPASVKAAKERLGGRE
ncbi:MAG: 5'-3' exonuclease H3TH domain-containing protein [Opitutales bacterium]